MGKESASSQPRSTARRSAALCCGATSLLGCERFGQTARDVLVKNTGDERLVRYTFFKRLNLNVTQIPRGQADVDSAIFNGGGTRSRLELR
jgi:hypothetical protein